VTKHKSNSVPGFFAGTFPGDAWRAIQSPRQSSRTDLDPLLARLDCDEVALDVQGVRTSRGLPEGMGNWRSQGFQADPEHRDTLQKSLV